MENKKSFFKTKMKGNHLRRHRSPPAGSRAPAGSAADGAGPARGHKILDIKQLEGVEKKLTKLIVIVVIEF